jgi:glycosyltransferase involved in cell wall biosynthesis/CDP-glycerol glycerophosphotransferase (TagB/SpsB family)
MAQNKEYTFSVVIPIYNTEDYLEEAIDSIVNQTIGFKKHIQLILVNDGSKDSSEDICLRYKNQYPDNIVYKYKENGGVASACNVGLELAEGKYVNFFGSDDIWSKETFYMAKQFFDLPESNEVDIVSFKLRRFGLSEQEHPLNYKYEETRVVDLLKEYSYIQLMNGNCIIRRSSIGNLRYRTEMRYMEDALFINEILLKTCKCGVVSEGCYYNRKRYDGSNLSTFVGKENKDRYLRTPKEAFEELFRLSKKYRGRVERFIQFSVAYEMQWRITEKLPESMTREEILQYYEYLKDTLQEIEDVIILKQKNLSFAKRAYVYKMKKGDDFFLRCKYRKGVFFDDEIRTMHVKGGRRLLFEIVEESGAELILKGETDLNTLNIPFEIYAKDNGGEVYYPTVENMPSRNIIAFNDDIIFEGNLLTFKLPLKAGNKYSFFVKIAEHPAFRISPNFGKYAKFDKSCEHSYWAGNNTILKLMNGRINIYKKTRKRHIMAELRRLSDLLKSDASIVEKTKFTSLRLLYYFYYAIYKHKRVWLLTDREKDATDNAAALWEYIGREMPSNGVKRFFVLSKRSKDYKKIRKYGKCIEPYSIKHKIMLLVSEKVISAYADQLIIRPYKGQERFIKDLINFDFVYLQHGIMQGDLSWWLNVLNKNIKMLVTGSKMETDNILAGAYGYDNSVVKELGVPRFDSVQKYEKKKKIVFLPTWRSSLAAPFIKGTREREYMHDFRDTDYFLFYNTLINDKRLIKAIEDSGYEAEFYLHPNYEKQFKDFTINKTIKLKEKNADYNRILGEAALLITDYSGVQFDFAYQRKPIIYTHFDDLYEHGSSHSYTYSYFDYEAMGFGPITKNIDEAVAEIIIAVNDNCAINKKYHKRADEFFEYSDNRNCERVYKALEDMD